MDTAANNMSLSHRELKNLRALSRKKQRLSQGCYLIEGLRLTREAVFSTADIDRILVSDKFASGHAWPALEAQAGSRGITITPITADQSDQLGATQHPQGIFAIVEMPVTLNRPLPPAIPPALILDGIADPGNLGTLLRTAEWFGIRSVLLTAASADVYNPKVVRGGMGAHFHLPVIWQGEPLKIARALESEDFLLLGATMDGGPLDQLPPINRRWALVIGSEAHGLGEFWQARLDKALTIPAAGSGESLNAAVAAGIILHYLQQHSTGNTS
jgi:TrmH family RNA methyltransferase